MYLSLIQNYPIVFCPLFIVFVDPSRHFPPVPASTCVAHTVGSEILYHEITILQRHIRVAKENLPKI
jgi:hypothetical protein